MMMLIHNFSSQDSLEKLAKRQLRDYEERQRLLMQYKSSDGPHNRLPGTIDPHDESSEVNKFAMSLASGFNYGFVSRSHGVVPSEDLADARSGPPPNIWALATQQFGRNLNSIGGEYQEEADLEDLTRRQTKLRGELRKLSLNTTAIWEQEGRVEAPL